MRDIRFLGIILIVATLFQTACAAQKRAEISEIEPEKANKTSIEADDKERTPVLVELFTSEG